MTNTIQFGYGNDVARMDLSKVNRHGIIAGATGTGKTVTLKVLAEQFSQAGIPVFLSDIKGDLMSLAEANSGEGLQKRLQATQYQDYTPQAFPIEIWDVFGQEGTALRFTISEMGPILLTHILGLNDVQASILNIVFDVADKEGLLLIDLMDLRAMLNFVAENAKDLSQHYGNISTRSIGAILRSLVILEKQGGDQFFSEPNLDIEDFMRKNDQGLGVINILNAQSLFTQPTMYSMALFALLSELYEVLLPEEGDLEQPKMVFFFDEAHTLFKDTPKALVEKIEMIVRLIRSKGVGVFFVTQNPTDIPDLVANQLGNRIQHGLRSYTPKELKVIKAVSETFRQAEDLHLSQVIQHLQVGEAVVSVLDKDGIPTFADKVMIYPPQSKIGTIEPSIMLKILNQSELADKYAETINRESAHEAILAATEDKEAILIQESHHTNQPSSDHPSIFDQIFGNDVSVSNQKNSGRRTDTGMDRLTKNMMSSVGRELGRIITRSITGMLKK